MARKIPLLRIDTEAASREAKIAAQVQSGVMTEEEAKNLRDLQAKAKPSPNAVFDYGEQLLAMLPIMPAGRSGNTNNDLRTLNRISNKIEAAIQAKQDFVLLEDADYEFANGRVNGFENWGPVPPAMSRAIEKFLDDMANAEKVEITEKPKDAAA